MSLVDHTIPSRESTHSITHAATRVQDELHTQDKQPSNNESSAPSDVSSSSVTHDNDIKYQDNMLDEYYDADDIMATESVKTEACLKSGDAPALPPRSNLRSSRLLNAFTMKLAAEEQTTTLSRATPQDVYLSSEEDASSSADEFDEFSDYDFESESEESTGSPVRRKSHEDTAKVVSVVFHPSIIDLPARRSAHDFIQDRPQSSLGTSVTSLRCAAFHLLLLHRRLLQPDPPAQVQQHTYEQTLDEEREWEQPVTPRTPTAILKRGLSIVRKRSKPALKDQFNSASTASLPLETKEQASPAATGPISYNDIMKAAKRNTRDSALMSPVSPAASSPVSSTGKNRILSSFHRRKSIKA
ncbi:conserved hypothetical protein [Verticillium alfalfae VaMs.102]|uniref:Uncharacterized protein n=1 Tax=Verticillium alfalfae (strain VaMs.102 / ATCC MYA-4576 / FGSC 10136) TaxID=526221 RepID=C9SG43_VERA1|nr:conserved hypothetical protein [Verticillium alfalfae VaMs.102]EEY18057.1 conserved hypothetical protein [Verticillium alfalfae VaMs.102]